MVGSVVCLINRAPYPLNVTKDGRAYILKPGENYVTSDIVRFARQQHPILGTQDPYNPMQCQFMVGVRAEDPKDQRDPIDLLPQELLDMLPSERLDRSKMPLDKQRVIEKTVPFPKGRQGLENPSAEGMMQTPEGAPL